MHVARTFFVGWASPPNWELLDPSLQNLKLLIIRLKGCNLMQNQVVSIVGPKGVPILWF